MGKIKKSEQTCAIVLGNIIPVTSPSTYKAIIKTTTEKSVTYITSLPSSFTVVAKIIRLTFREFY